MRHTKLIVVGYALLVVGCASSSTPPSKAVRAYGGAERSDRELATLIETDAVYIKAIDEQLFPGSDKPFSLKGFFENTTYAIAPGQRTVMVEYQGIAGSTSVFSYNDRRIDFTAQAGHRYSLKSNIAFFHPAGLQDKHWCPAVYDETSKQIVGQAAEARSGESKDNTNR